MNAESREAQMEPSIAVAMLWLLFAGTHIGLASGRVRGELVARLGALGFTLLFFLVAAVAFSLLVHYYAEHRLEGGPGPGLGTQPVFGWIASAVSGLGLVLVSGSVAAYPRSPMALFTEEVRPPYGLERVTRHPFFIGVALLAVAHALAATRLVGVVFFGGFALFTISGARHQDVKLRALRGPAYADYFAVTSTWPFAAVPSGRERIVWRELPAAALAMGLVFVLALRWVHDGILGHGGAWVIGTVVGAAGFATLRAWRRSG